MMDELATLRESVRKLALDRLRQLRPHRLQPFGSDSSFFDSVLAVSQRPTVGEKHIAFHELGLLILGSKLDRRRGCERRAKASQSAGGEIDLYRRPPELACFLRFDGAGGLSIEELH
jgi:hypothetical protein